MRGVRAKPKGKAKRLLGGRGGCLFKVVRQGVTRTNHCRMQKKGGVRNFLTISFFLEEVAKSDAKCEHNKEHDYKARWA